MARAGSAPLIEVFTSIQGEGRFAGVPMGFVRTAGCPIRCLYCDTPESYSAAATFAVHAAEETHHESNPVDGAGAAACVRGLLGSARSVSVTGGEPLLFPEFVRGIGEALRDAGIALHLETAALHPEALSACLPSVDHLSADYKLPGTLEKGDHRAQHVDCLARAAESDATIDVKLVLTPDVEEAALGVALQDLQRWRERVLLVLQPVTPFGAVRTQPPAARVARFADRASELGFDVRVLPQLHKHLGLR